MFDPLPPGSTDPIAGLVDPQTFDTVRSQWNSFLENPQGRASLLSAGLALMQPPSFGDNPMSQIGRAIGAGGQSATANEIMDLKKQEAESKDASRESVANARQTQAEAAMARAEAAGARAGSAGDRLALQQARIDAQNERANLNARVRLSNMYQNYVAMTSKANQNAKLMQQPEQPVLPMTDWIKANPTLGSLGLLPPTADSGTGEGDVTIPPAADTTTAPPMPRDKSLLRPNQRYTLPNGDVKTWSGTGFR